MFSIIEQFCNVTGANESSASKFLSMCENDLDMAVSLYMDSPMQTDETTASTSNLVDIDAIRAPIPQRSEVLVPDEAEGYPHIPVIHRRVIPMRSILGTSRSVFSAFQSPGDLDVVDSDENEEGPIESGQDIGENRNALISTSRGPQIGGPSRSSGVAVSSNASRKRGRLEAIFKPPTDICFQGDFRKACDAGKEANKWLLVSIHDTREFPCHILNRDVWKHETVRAIVQASFILWQVDKDSNEGTYYTQFYPYKAGPHIAIIDPLTGEHKMQWTGVTEPAKVCLFLTEFLADHQPHPDQHRSGNTSPVPSKRAKMNLGESASGHTNGSSCLNGASTSTRHLPIITLPQDDIHLLSEDEQLRLAMEASKREADASQPRSPSSSSESTASSRRASRRTRNTNVGKSSGGSGDRRRKVKGESRTPTKINGAASSPIAISDTEEYVELCDESSRSSFVSIGSSSIVDNDNDTTVVDLGSTTSAVDPDAWKQYVGSPDSPVCHLLLRLPCGKRDTISLPLSSQLKALILYLEGRGYPSSEYEIVRTYPRLVLSDLEPTSTLEAANMSAKDTLFVQER